MINKERSGCKFDLLKDERFPKSAKYRPELLVEADMGPHVLWLTEFLCEVIDLRAGMRVLAAPAMFTAESVGFPGVSPLDGAQTLDYVYVDDAVEATLRALTGSCSSEVINVGSGEGVRVIELLAAMQKVSGSHAVIEHGPADWTAGTSRIATIEKAKALLSWQPQVSLSEGLSRTYAWLREPAS